MFASLLQRRLWTCWCTKSHRNMAHMRVSLLVSLLNKLLCHSIFMSKKTTALGAVVPSLSVVLGGWFITAQTHQGNHSHIMTLILEGPQHWGEAVWWKDCRGSGPAFHSYTLGWSVLRASTHPFTDSCPVSVFRLKASATLCAYVESPVQKRLWSWDPNETLILVGAHRCKCWRNNNRWNITVIY